jgi:hypothetical protein
MGTTPVTLDLSKAQALPQPAPVKLDMSKAVSISEPDSVFVPSHGYGGGGSYVSGTPSEIQGIRDKQNAGIAAGIGLATGAAAAPVIGALTAPTVATEAVGTGILDASGNEIMKDVMSYGPSTARAVLSHPLTQKLLMHAAGWATGGAILKYLGVGHGEP